MNNTQYGIMINFLREIQELTRAKTDAEKVNIQISLDLMARRGITDLFSEVIRNDIRTNMLKGEIEKNINNLEEEIKEADTQVLKTVLKSHKEYMEGLIRVMEG